MKQEEIKKEDVKALLKFIVAGYFYDVITNSSLDKSNFNISDREKEVLKLVADGMTNDDIAKQLYMSKTNVETKIDEIFAKLENKDRTKSAVYALKNKSFAL